jgi:hypothetical protein
MVASFEQYKEMQFSFLSPTDEEEAVALAQLAPLSLHRCVHGLGELPVCLPRRPLSRPLLPAPVHVHQQLEELQLQR